MLTAPVKGVEGVETFLVVALLDEVEDLAEGARTVGEAVRDLMDRGRDGARLAPIEELVELSQDPLVEEEQEE